MTTSTETRLLLNRYRSAEYLSCSTSYIDKHVRAGRLAPVKLGRKVLFYRSELERFAAANCRPAS